MSLQEQPPVIRPSPLNGVVPPARTQFHRGVSGNRAGVPKTVSEAKRLAAKATPEIIARFIKIALGDEPRYAIPAGIVVVERGLGKVPTMRELYPLKQDADTSAASGLTDEQSSRIYAILKEGKNA